jgi:hypothetical protein
MADAHLLQRARSALDSLGASLQREYSQCAILTEADAQIAVVEHLKKELRDHDEGWIVGANHPLGSSRPDVVCYYAPLTYDGFVSDYLDGDRALVAIIEVKWFFPLKDDLAKLTRLQRESSGQALAWMVYGGHFDPSIHRAYAAEDERRGAAIRAWAEKGSGLRGHTIVRCGGIAGHGGSGERVRAIRERWWINDRAAHAGRLPRVQPGCAGELSSG